MYSQEAFDYFKTKEGDKWYESVRVAYENAPDGEKLENPYYDFWHFMLDDYFGEISNGCMRTVNYVEAKERAKHQWQKDVCDFFIKEYGEKDIEVEISW